jgi:energy-coupling factor transporter ATP-binding protein EcfA2
MVITHDVDEAIMLADHVVMMTNGPRAKVSKMLEINLPRSRTRTMLLEHLGLLAFAQGLARPSLRNATTPYRPSSLRRAAPGLHRRHACSPLTTFYPPAWRWRAFFIDLRGGANYLELFSEFW